MLGYIARVPQASIVILRIPGPVVSVSVETRTVQSDQRVLGYMAPVSSNKYCDSEDTRSCCLSIFITWNLYERSHDALFHGPLFPQTNIVILRYQVVLPQYLWKLGSSRVI